MRKELDKFEMSSSQNVNPAITGFSHNLGKV